MTKHLRYIVMWVISYMITIFVVNKNIEYFGLPVYLRCILSNIRNSIYRISYITILYIQK